jgi:UPF0176 protein
MERVNVAAYKFANLTGLKPRRERLREIARELGLKGTILLAQEGINLFVAGVRPGVEQLIAELERDPEIGPLETKWSPASEEPFRRMLVKIKREIIAFGVPGLPIGEGNTQRLSPQELKAWLDEGRDLVLLDTRNDYEIKLGTFEGAEVCHIDHFRQFPQVAETFPDEWKSRPVVTFCTGGIRCEKAAPLLDQMGFRKVFQLDGGILRYFEQVGRDHYQGDCFVFDQRVAIDAALEETNATQCYVCQAVLTPEEQAEPTYVKYKSCPYCFMTPREQMERTLTQRQAKLASIASPLPGCKPYDNVRPMFVPSAMAGATVLDFLSTSVPVLGRDQWLAEIVAGHVLLAGRQFDPEYRATPGERFDHVLPGFVEPEVNAEIRFLYEDSQVVVVDKPAPLPMHPSGRFNKNTLVYLLNQLYRPQRVRPAHRLDANTTGLVVCGRTTRINRLLQQQFADGRVDKVYMARVVGHPQLDDFVCNSPVGKEPGVGGVRRLDPAGLPALTRFKVIDRNADGTSLIEAYPETGRTNQIRLHLWSLGHPVKGDPVYLPGGAIGGLQTLAMGDPPMCLHSWQVRLVHPTSGERMEWRAELPPWATSGSLPVAAGPAKIDAAH